MMNNKLPNDPVALILGILALVIMFLGCCCGLFTIVSLILSVIGLVLANKSLNEFSREHESYSVASYKNMNAAKIIGIIGIALSILILVSQIAFFVFKGEEFSREFFDEIRKNGRFERDFDYGDENKEANVQLKKVGDSIYLDTIQTETTTTKVKEQ